MNNSRWFQVLLAIASGFSIVAWGPTTAATFDSTEVNSDQVVAIAAPFGRNNYQLLVLEQLSTQRACWSESGSNPVKIEPLLLSFDFTGICGRSTDSNGYSLRANGQDLGLEYILRVVARNGDLVLVGTNRRNRRAPDIEMGRTQGISTGYNKILLNSGWRFTKRTYQGKPLGHIYLTSDSLTPPSNLAVNPTPPSLPIPEATPSQPTAPLRELIFTKPDSTPASVERPLTNAQIPSQPIPRSTPASSDRPATSSQILPPPPTLRSRVPVFVVPTNN